MSKKKISALVVVVVVVVRLRGLTLNPSPPPVEVVVVLVVAKSKFRIPILCLQATLFGYSALIAQLCARYLALRPPLYHTVFQVIYIYI